MNIGHTSDITAGFRGDYKLSVDNPATGQRWEYAVGVPDTPDSQVRALFFPPTVEEVQR